MDPLVQWAITTIVAILTFFGGRAFEQRRIANQNRLKLLEPIEAWVDMASRIVSIVKDDLSAISTGLPFAIGYSMQEKIDTSKIMDENRDKVLGILNSKALTMRSTKSLSIKLKDSLTRLNMLIEREYLQTHTIMMNKSTAHQDISSELHSLIQMSLITTVLFQDIHTTLSELKTKFN